MQSAAFAVAVAYHRQHFRLLSIQYAWGTGRVFRCSTVDARCGCQCHLHITVTKSAPLLPMPLLFPPLPRLLLLLLLITCRLIDELRSTVRCKAHAKYMDVGLRSPKGFFFWY